MHKIKLKKKPFVLSDAFKERLRRILGTNDTPHRTGLALAIGLFFAFSPLLGLHAILALLTAWAMKLNRLVVISGLLVNNPWTLMPISMLCIWTGSLIMGEEVDMPEINWSEMSMLNVFTELKGLFMPFFIGSFFIGAASAVIGYFFMKNAVEKFRKRRKRKKAMKGLTEQHS